MINPDQETYKKDRLHQINTRLNKGSDRLKAYAANPDNLGADPVEELLRFRVNLMLCGLIERSLDNDLLIERRLEAILQMPSCEDSIKLLAQTCSEIEYTLQGDEIYTNAILLFNVCVKRIGDPAGDWAAGLISRLNNAIIDENISQNRRKEAISKFDENTIVSSNFVN